MLVEPWRIEMFGGLRLSQGDRTITRFRTHKTAAVLAYLALYGSRQHPREELIDLFWPDADPAAGRTSLRTALASIRAQIEPPGAHSARVLEADRYNIRLNPAAFHTDVLEFESRLRSASASAGAAELDQLGAAISLYCGELLPGFYEDWACAERSRLEDVALRGMLALAELQLKASRPNEALGLLHRAAAIDPYREETHRALMQTFAASGSTAGVRRTYSELKTLLRSALNARPDPSTEQLLNSLLKASAGKADAPQPEDAQDEAGPPHNEAAPPSPAENRGARNLPVALTRFFGREHELERTVALLTAGAGPRLVTLTGMGGAGKTRLAVEASRYVERAHPSRVFFAPLADIHDISHVPDRILSAVSAVRAGNVDTEKLLADHLGSGFALIVLDNFEQLAARDDDRKMAAALLGRILTNSPDLRLLVTSRCTLGVTGEQELPVSPLPTPAVKASAGLLMEFPCIQLFVDRAQLVKPDFQVSVRNAEVVGRICHRLEGIPLAIELAAAWARALTPAQIIERLAHRFDLLVSRRHDVTGRHATLRSAIDWSCELLEPELRSFLTQLSIFSGGWTLDAAEEVCEQTDALELTARLIERSLITADTDIEPVARYRMLDTVRDYAREALSAVESAALARRHAAWCMRMAEESERNQTGPDSGAWMDRLDADLDNIRAALARSIGAAGSDRSNGETALRIAGALWRYWYLRGRSIEGAEWYRQVLALPSADPKSRLHARAIVGAGNLAAAQGENLLAERLFKEGIEIHRRLGNLDGLAGALSNLGTMSNVRGDYAEARRLQEEALAFARQDGNRVRIANILNNLGNVASGLRRYEDATAYLEESLDIKKAIGDTAGVGTVLSNLGDIAHRIGRLEVASAYFIQALKIKREAGDTVGAAIALTNLGSVSLDIGAPTEAHLYFEESLGIWRDMRHREGITNVLEGLAYLALVERQPARAVRLFASAERIREEIDYRLTDEDRTARGGMLKQAREQLGELKFAACKMRGAHEDVDSAIEFALDRAVGAASGVE